MNNYDNDVLGVGNVEHPANEIETESMSFQQAMDSLSPEQREAIEEEFIDRNSQADRYAKKLAKGKEIMQAIMDAKEVMNKETVGDWGTDKYINKAEWNKAYFTVQKKEEELKKLLLGL